MNISDAQQKHLEEVTRLIPGYDAWATAEDCTFDYNCAQYACDFFPECLTHTKGEWTGQPIILEPWQQGIIANIFGWKRPDGTRRYRQALIYVPRKNAKTTIAAGIALYLLYLDDEPGAEIYCAAADEEQATISFDSAKGMVLACDALARRGQVFGSSITYQETNSFLKVLTSKATTKHGKNPHGILIDELHAQKDRELVDTLNTGVGARRQPLTLYLTTADFAKPSICNETHDYASKIRDGIIVDKSFLPVIYEATRNDDWTKEETWKKANPNYGISVKKDYIIAACTKAQNSPANENTFKRLHLNIVTEQADRWLALEAWDQCAGAVDWKDLAEVVKGRECFGGLDLASTRDLAAFVLAFPPKEEGERTVVLPFFWVPRDSARDREHKDRVPYPLWGTQGAIRLTHGNVIDYDQIKLDIIALGKIFNISEIAIDRWASAQITNQLTEEGFEMIAFGQGFASMSAPTKELEKLIIGSEIYHGGHPVLRWNASNVALESDAAGNIKPSKKKSLEKIDGIVALVMAIGCLQARKLGSKTSIYETQGLTTT